jgi:hypothetical protein
MSCKNLFGLLFVGIVACSHTQGRLPLGDGNELAIEGRGTKANLSMKCLTENQIKQLTGSMISPTVEKASCYTVIFVSADSSAISKAITAYARADNELNDDVAAAVTGGKVPASTSVGGEIAKKIVSETVVSNTKDTKIIEADVRGIVQHLDEKNKTELKATLQAISVNAIDPVVKTRVDAALSAVQ